MPEMLFGSWCIVIWFIVSYDMYFVTIVVSVVVSNSPAVCWDHLVCETNQTIHYTYRVGR